MAKFKVTFFIKNKYSKANSEFPIYGKLQLDSQIATFATGKSINPVRWNKTNKLTKASRNKDEALTKEYLLQTKRDLDSIFLEKRKLQSACNVTDIKNSFLGKHKSKELTVVQLIKLHNTHFQARVHKKERSQATLEKYERVAIFLLQYVNSEYGKKDIDISNIDNAFVFGLEDYFKFKMVNHNTHKMGIAHNTTVKYMRAVNTFMLFGVQRGLLPKNPFNCYQEKLNEVETVFLTKAQLKVIEEKEFLSNRLNTVRDLFIFSCYTSYAPVDVMKLTWDNVSADNDGDLWIKTRRQKTNVESNILILPVVKQILYKYKDDPRTLKRGSLLPNISNQKMNEYLKEIAAICGLNINLTWYVARHTFATTIGLGNAIPLEHISKVMGHKNIKQTQHYAKLQDQMLKVSFDRINKSLK